MSTDDGQLDGVSSPKSPLTAIQALKARLLAVESGPIAIVGAGLRLPGGVASLDGYWSLLTEGRDAVRPVPAERWDADAWTDPDPDAPGKMRTRNAGFLDDIASFDAGFFGISPREALELDPAQRLLLEVAWEALESAGIAPDRLDRSPTGVYVGLGLSDYGRRHFLGPDPTRMTAYSGTGSFLSVAAGRISYTLGLQGPSMTVDTACSASLVAVHLAVDALRRGEVDLALAGGANVICSPEPSVYFSKLQATSPDGRCKTFDAAADGYGRGEGAAVLALKRLSDAVAAGDPVLAVIRGTAVNHDGRSNGLTAPNGAAQQAVVRAALANAGVSAEQIGYVEAHGTGTPLGDPIEVDALRAVFGPRPAGRPLRIGSVKTNLGHLETAAGVTGLLKLALCVQRGAVPPHLHLAKVNPRIRLDGLEIPTRLAPWTDEVRIGGVSAFGLSGTNAHIVVEQAPPPAATDAEARPIEIVTLSARSDQSLAALAGRWAEALPAHPLPDAARTAIVGRAQLPSRVAVVARDAREAADRLAAFARGEVADGVARGVAKGSLAPPVVFLFTGQGAQHVGMGRRLYEAEPAFRDALDQCFDTIDPLIERPLREVMWSDGAPIDQTRWTQPALFALEVALVRFWRTLGVEPEAMLGHSVGEIVAAHVAGVLSLEDAALLVVERGRMMQALPAGGAMASIAAPEAEVAAAVDARRDTVGIAAVNGPSETVISGVDEHVHEIAGRFEARGVRVRRLAVSHAFHSPLMEPMLDGFEELARTLTWNEPTIQVISNVDGKPAGRRLRDPRYWRQHVRSAVRFADGLRTLIDDELSLFLELGPRPVLSGAGARAVPEPAARAVRFVSTLHPDRDDQEQVTSAMGQLWALGATIDLRTRSGRGPRAPMPTMPWRGERYWLEPVAAPIGAQPAARPTPLLEIGWQPAPAPRRRARGRWRVVGDAELAAVLEARGATVVDAGEEHVVVAADAGSAAEIAASAAATVSDALRAGASVHLVAHTGRAPASAALRGLGRTVAVEAPDRWGGFVDVADGASVDAVVDALLADDGEDLARVDGSGRSVARLAAYDAPAEPIAAPAEGAVLVTGGFGAVGRAVARMLADRGAKRLVLAGRSGAGSAEAKALIAELEGRGVAVEGRKVDVANRRSFKALLGKIDDLVGVVHAAGTTDDGLLRDLDRGRIEAVVGPKADGATLLDELTADRDLALFVLVSSVSGWTGVPGQAAYAAANAVLDAVAAARRARGQRAVSVVLGPIDGVGLAGELPTEVRERWAADGVRPVSLAAAIDALGRAAAGTSPVVALAPFDWDTWSARRPSRLAAGLVAERPAPAAQPAATALVDALSHAPSGARRAMLLDHVQLTVSRVLGMPPERRIGLEDGFFDAGMDSLMAMDLHDRLQSAVGQPLPATLVFDRPTAAALTDVLLGTLALDAAPDREAAAAPARGADGDAEPVAIVGIACRLPGHANDLGTLWEVHRDRLDVVTRVPRDRFDVERFYDPTPGTPGRLYVREGGFVDHIAEFEPAAFGISPREATSLDPQQRMLLECSWHALEDAAIPADRLRGRPVGVYVGIGPAEYWARFDPTIDEVDAYAGTGNETSFAAGRVSYVLGLQGPSMSVNTACSSSLVATHLAVQALRRGECELALAGGVNAIVGPETTIWMSMLQALAPDARCKAFDERANGYVRAEGCGVVVLKRLSDALRDGDRIHAVIRGTAVDHDGASSGLTVPNGLAQQRVIRDALADAGVDAQSIGYVECHGTGTRIGDPIEVEALGTVLAAGRPADRPLWLGAAKANHGHLEAGAGVAGMLRAILALQHRTVPPIAHLHTPNPALPLDRFPALRLPTDAEPWDADGPRRAGVSSFGISGTNAHLVLEEAPERSAPALAPSARPTALLAVSGRSEGQVRALAGQLASADVSLADLAFTLNTGRSHGPSRAAVVAADLVQARAGLRAVADGTAPVATSSGAPRVVFLCTGAGPQAFGMARALADVDPVFRDALHAAAAAADPHLDRPLLDVIYPGSPLGTGRSGPDEAASPLHDLAYTQPAMFAIEWATAALWRSWGVEPAAVIGHSTGQYVAATLAGVFDLQVGMALMAKRARLMSDQPKTGAMVACFAPEDRIVRYLRGHEQDVSFAAVNGPAEVVLSGRAEVVEALASRIEADGVEIRRLNISHAAHSPLMDPILDRFERMVGEVPLARPTLPLIENVHGAVAGHDVISPRYWREHMRAPVQFFAGMRTLVDQGFRVFLEIGNHPVLAGAGARCVEDLDDAVFLPSMRRDRPDWEQMLDTAGALHRLGATLDWRAFHAGAPGRRVALPVTPFQRKRYWVERRERHSSRLVGQEWTVAPSWQPVRPNVDPFGSRGDRPLLVLADAHGLGDALAARQHRRTVVVRPGTGFHLDGGRATVDPADPAQLERLVREVAPAHVVHLWALDVAIDDSAVDAALPAVRSAAFVLRAAQAVGGVDAVWLVTRGAASVDGEAPAVGQAPVLGLGNAAAVELTGVGVVRVDLDPGEGARDVQVAHLELALNTGLREEQVAIRGGQHFVRRLVRVPALGTKPPPIREDATYLVTGGLGAIGLQVARWLISRGAGRVVLTSRHDRPEAADTLERLGDRVAVVLADVAAPGAVDGLLAEIARRGWPPVRGVFHAAGLLDDGWLADLGPDRWDAVLRPKLDGTVALQRALPDAELFVLFSSAASLLGNPGQANYAAANAFLDAVAQARRAVGRHAVSLCWGPWGEAGLANDAARQWERSGVRPLPPSLAIEVLEQRLGGPEPVVGVLDLDWRRWAEAVPRAPAAAADLVKAAAPPPAAEPERARRSALDGLTDTPAPRRRDALAAIVAAEAGAILGQDAAELNPRVGFFDSGMDSLMAVELAKRLRVRFARTLPATVAFDHPTIEALTGWLYAELGLDTAAAEPSPSAAPAADRRVDLDAPIAIVGVSCRMPGGANDPEAFWALLRSGRDPMREVPPERWDLGAFYDPAPGTRGKMYVREAGWVDQPLVEGFDPEFFGISGREAEILDPQQRMLLEVSYEALERAGLTTPRLEHSRTGVFVGVGSSGWLQRFQAPGGLLYDDQYAGTGSLEAFVSGRVAFALGLHGPNLALNTACSSALVAIHLACQALRAGEAEQALAGGVHLMLSPENFVYVSQLRALAADGRCKTFDAAADGYGRAEGCGMLVLKRLDDARRDGDPVLAVIRGTAVGHDGPSSGLTVPYGPAQVQVLAEAVARSGLDPLDVSYLEAHGTGTVLGDPIEIHAAEEVYCRGRTADNPLHIGAVKSNIGHLEVAAGAASVIKMVLALQHREIPPHLHFHRANPDLDLDGHHMVVDTAPTPWTSPRGPLRCGISGFGLAGTNVHLVLEEAPEPARPAPAAADDRPVHVLPLSARSAEALRDLARRTSDRLAEVDGADPQRALADLAFSAATTRIPYEHRLAVVAPDGPTAVERLRAFADEGEAPYVTAGRAGGRPRVAFLFSGQGAQYPGMGRELYETWPVFRDVVDRCAAVLDPLLPRPILDVMFRDLVGDADAADVHDTAYTQPALFVLEVALAALWRSWGVVPDAVLGHSIGHLAAATVAGVLSLEDGLRLVAERGRLMSSLPRNGAMAAVFADEAAVRAALAPHLQDVAVAAVNNPGEVTISGRTEAVDAVLAALAADGVQGRRLVVSHAFHSPLMAPILDAFREAAARATYHTPKVPVVCNRTGRWATDADLCDPAYWRDLIQEPVRFADGLQTLGDDGYTVFVEVGPHTALLGMGRRTLLDRTFAWIPSLQRGEPAFDRLVPALGAVWCRGVDVDWAAWDAPWPRTRVALPTYPWQRRRVWPELPEFPGQQAPGADWLVAWSYEDRPAAVGAVGGNWRVIGAGALADRVRAALVARGARLVDAAEADAGVVVVPAVPDGLGADPTAPAVQLLDAVQPLAGSAPLTVVTQAAQPGGGALRPLGATLWGLGRVVRAERPELQSVLIDVDDQSDDTALVDAIAATDREPEVLVRAGRRQVGRLVRSGFSGGGAPALDGTVLVTGGLAGLGLEAAAWLAAHGATHLVLVGRSAPSPDAEARLEALRRGGTAVVVERGDVSSAADVERIVTAIADRGEVLIGVVHAAGVLADASLARLDAAAFRKAFAPKVHGTWNLHRATEDLPLRFFVLFAAGAGLLGAPGQGNYAAANAFQDAFAHWRRTTGRPTTAIDWGTWAEVGMAARASGLLERQAAEGMRAIPLDAGLGVFGRLLGHGAAQVGVLAVDWARLVDVVHRGVCPPVLERLVAAPAPGASVAAAAAAAVSTAPRAGLRALLDGRPQETWDEAIEAVVHDAAVRILRLPKGRVLDRGTPLLDLGLDSLTAIELKNAIMDDGVDLPVARVMTGPSIRQIAIMIRQVLESEAPAERTAADTPAVRRSAATDDEPAFSPITTHLMSFGFGFVLMAAVVVAYWASTQIFEPRAVLDGSDQPEAAEAPAEPPAGKAKQGKRKAKAE